jgi:hypothetical protein
MAWQPSELLAFRSYVATGGALLVVVSPGWSHAAPSVVNPLIALFGVHARSESLPVRVEGPLNHDHPIGRGLAVQEILAKDAVPLDAPPGTAVAGSDEQKLLVAVPYREGRGVVAAMGQWFLPDVSDLGQEWWQRCPSLVTKAAIDESPIETGENAQLPLLKNVIAWLAEPVAGRPEGQRLPDAFLTAHQVALEVLYRVRHRDELPAALAALVAAAGAGALREEALWAAGEALKPLQWFDARDEMRYGWPTELGPPTLDTQYFDALVKSYPLSELAPYARWERAEFGRLNRMYTQGRWNWTPEVFRTYAAGSIAEFAKIDAPRGTSPWTWTELRIALLHLRANQPEQALEHARAVADAVALGPEKTIALTQAAVASWQLGQIEQARRYYQVIQEAPDVQFVDETEGASWALAWWIKERQQLVLTRNSSRYVAQYQAGQLEEKRP